MLVSTIVGSRLQYSGNALESLKRTLRPDVMLHRMRVVRVTSTYVVLKIYECVKLFKISVRRIRKLQILIVNNSEIDNKQIEFLLKPHYSNVSTLKQVTRIGVVNNRRKLQSKIQLNVRADKLN